MSTKARRIHWYSQSYKSKGKLKHGEFTPQKHISLHYSICGINHTKLVASKKDDS